MESTDCKEAEDVEEREEAAEEVIEEAVEEAVDEAVEEVVDASSAAAFNKITNTAILQRKSRSRVVKESVVSQGISGTNCLNKTRDEQKRQFGQPLPDLIHLDMHAEWNTLPHCKHCSTSWSLAPPPPGSLHSPWSLHDRRQIEQIMMIITI